MIAHALKFVEARAFGIQERCGHFVKRRVDFVNELVQLLFLHLVERRQLAATILDPNAERTRSDALRVAADQAKQLPEAFRRQPRFTFFDVKMSVEILESEHSQRFQFILYKEKRKNKSTSNGST